MKSPSSTNCWIKEDCLLFDTSIPFPEIRELLLFQRTAVKGAAHAHFVCLVEFTSYLSSDNLRLPVRKKKTESEKGKYRVDSDI